MAKRSPRDTQQTRRRPSASGGEPQDCTTPPNTTPVQRGSHLRWDTVPTSVEQALMVAHWADHQARMVLPDKRLSRPARAHFERRVAGAFRAMLGLEGKRATRNWLLHCVDIAVAMPLGQAEAALRSMGRLGKQGAQSRMASLIRGYFGALYPDLAPRLSTPRCVTEKRRTSSACPDAMASESPSAARRWRS